jgi:DUF1707 SHOCT-like domain
VAGPGDEIAAAHGGGRGGLRASRADREQAAEQLKVAFVQGRLDRDEFDARVGQALTARTCTELATVTADLPAVPTAARPPGLAPGPSGQASQRPPTVGPGGQLPSAGHGQQHIAEAARGDPAHPRSPGSRSAHQWRHRRHRYAIGYADA